MVVVITRRRVNCQLVKWHASVHRTIALQLITVKASLSWIKHSRRNKEGCSELNFTAWKRSELIFDNEIVFLTVATPSVSAFQLKCSKLSNTISLSIWMICWRLEKMSIMSSWLSNDLNNDLGHDLKYDFDSLTACTGVDPCPEGRLARMWTGDQRPWKGYVLKIKGSYHKKILSPKPHILDGNGVW